MSNQLVSLWDRLFSAADAIYSFLVHPDLANILSVVGAAITVYVAFSVRDLRRRVIFKVRAPEVIRELTERASRISGFLQDFTAGLAGIEEELALAQVTLKNVSDKVSGPAKTTIQNATDIIGKFRSSQNEGKTADVAREVYLQILIAKKAIENLAADFREEP